MTNQIFDFDDRTRTTVCPYCVKVGIYLTLMLYLDSDFDDGELRSNPDNARKEVQAMIELMEELIKSPNAVIHSAASNPLRYVYQTVCQRLFKVCTYTVSKNSIC